MTNEEAVALYRKKIATAGGIARARSLTKQRRIAIARKAARIRWAKKGSK